MRQIGELGSSASSVDPCSPHLPTLTRILGINLRVFLRGNLTSSDGTAAAVGQATDALAAQGESTSFADRAIARATGIEEARANVQVHSNRRISFYSLVIPLMASCAVRQDSE